MPSRTSLLLGRLRDLRGRFGGAFETEKLEILRQLQERPLSRAADVLDLHELLCFWRAYPDGPTLLAQVDRMLARFDRRRDLRRYRRQLADSGIAGTAMHFAFFAPTASWLVRRYGEHVKIDWKRFEEPERLERLLPNLTLYAETPGLDEWDFGLRGWIRRLKSPRETDAAFVVRRFQALEMDTFAREALYDGLDLPLVLEAGERTPARTRSRHLRSPVVWQKRSLDGGRPRLPQDILRSPISVRRADDREARRLIDLSREAMVSRQRDLDIFSFASPQDVRIVECGDGLQFVCMGATPERRLLLEAVYGFLTLKNGVPVGYVLCSALYGSSEIAFNVFETYRAGEAGRVYGKVLAMVQRIFGARAFTIVPFQLGMDNEEALQSGAWWFYQKCGFRPRDPGALRIMRREGKRMARRPRYRSSIATLERLAASNLFYFLGKPRDDVIGIVELPNVGLRVSASLAERFGSDRERAAVTCSREAARLLGLRSMKGFSRGERLAWERWSPLVPILPGVERWSAAAKRSLVRVIRAKGGQRESDFVTLFDRHAPLRRAILELAEGSPR